MSNTRGVATLKRNYIPFSLEHVESDSEGRFVLVSGHIYGVHLTIGHVYALDTDNTSFISHTVFQAVMYKSGILGW